MADVLGTFYQALKVRQGTSPSSPGFVVGEVPSTPVNPPGTFTNSFITLTDAPNSYSGQAGKVVAVKSDETGLEFVTASSGGLTLSSPLTGYVVGSNTALTDSNTVLEGFQNLQGQVNARVSASPLGVSDRVAVFSGTNSITSYAGLAFFNSANRLDILNTAGTAIQISLRGTTSGGIIAGGSGGASTIFHRPAGDGVATMQVVHTTTGFGINVTPTNPLDVNGTVRIRSTANLGTTTTNVLVQSATGVVSFRTLAELATDGGFSSNVVQLVTTAGTINNLTITGNILIFSGATVTLTGIVAGTNGLPITIINRTGSNMTIAAESGSSTGANRFSGGVVIPNNASTVVAYSTTLTRWIHQSTGAFVASGFSGTRVFGNFTAGDASASPNSVIAGLFRSTSNDANSLPLRCQSLNGTTIFEVYGNFVSVPTFSAFGGVNAIAQASINVRPITNSSNFSIRITDFAGTQRVLVPDSCDWQSLAGASFGVGVTSAPVARVDIRGRGTTTGITLLLEDSAGTDNVRFLDNGQILFLRLPTSSAGLATGTLWNDSGTLKIA